MAKKEKLTLDDLKKPVAPKPKVITYNLPGEYVAKLETIAEKSGLGTSALSARLVALALDRLELPE